MSILDRLRRRPGSGTVTTFAVDDTPAVRPQTRAELGDYGGPSTTSYVTAREKRSRTLLNATTLTPRLVRAMREHPTITAGLAVQSLPLLRAQWAIDCDDDDVRAQLEALYGRIHGRVVRSMARCLWAGYSPNVLVWDIDPDTAALTIRSVRDLDPFTCTARVDDAGSYVGFDQRSPIDSQVITVDVLESLWGVEGMESGNLYGRPLLAAARQPWQDQQAVGLYHLRYLERFGEPVVLMRAPTGVVDLTERERADALAWNADHPDDPREVPAPRLVAKIDQALELGENLRHHSVLALPSEGVLSADGKSIGRAWDAEFMSAGSADGKAFAEKIADLDRAMLRGMIVPSLILEGGDTVGSNALGQSHRDTFSENVNARLADYAEQITQHVIRRLVAVNGWAVDARLTFAPVGDETIERLWTLMGTLVQGNALAVDAPAIAARLGVPILMAEDEPNAAASSPFTQVGLPALVAAGIMTETEARQLIGLEGEAPGKPEVEAAFMAARAGHVDLARAILGLGEHPEPGDALHVHPGRRDDDGATFAAAPADVEGLPEWRLPQSYDPPAFRRALTVREERIGFARLEQQLNATEARAVDELVALLEQSHDRVARQVQGIMRKGGSVADIVAALGTVNVGPVAPWVSAWQTLQRDVWGFGLDSVRRELEAFANAVPGDIGRDGLALVKAYATNSAERTLADLSTRVRTELLSSLRSGVSPTGMLATVAQVYDKASRSEGAPPRLTTRMLSSKALNEGRRDAIERGGIPLQGAQFSAILDKRTCGLCERLDEQLIAIADTDLVKFTPPLHHNCRCVWVWVAAGEEGFTPSWSAPSKSLVDQYGGLVFGS